MYPKILIFFILLLISFQPVKSQSLEEVINIIEKQYYDTAYNNSDWEKIKTENRIQFKNSDSRYDLIHQVNDPGLRLLSNSEFQNFLQEVTTEAHIGVGLQELFSIDINQNTGLLEVIVPVPNSPADKAGLRSGDIIKTINAVPVSELSLHEAMKALRVAKGQSVNITIERAGKTMDFNLKAQEINPPLFPRYRIISHKGQNIGLIWIPQFSAGMSIRVSQILLEFQEKKVDGVIIDLRNNPGGFIQESRNTLGLFIGEKPIAHIQGITSAIKMTHSVGKQKTKLPLTVLVNEGTASAAELFAGTLQYYQRADIVGTPTAGKGLIYSFFNLSDDSALIVPVGRMRMLDYRDIVTQGIAPDVLLEAKKPFKLQKNYKKDKVLKQVIKQMVD